MKWLITIIFLFLSCANQNKSEHKKNTIKQSLKNNLPKITEEKTLINKIELELKNQSDSEEFSKNLISLLKKWHPGEQEKIYHSFMHTLLVADLMRKVLKNNNGLTKEQKLLLLLSALFHDLDPKRTLNSPPKVEETIKILDDEEISFVFDFIKKNQLITLIHYTNFNKDPSELKKLLSFADKLAKKSFKKNLPWAKEWGRKLATIDKLAMYVHTWDHAKKSVINLAFEIKGPEEKMLEDTYDFLSLLTPDLEDLNLSNKLKDNFNSNLKKFKDLAKK